MEMNIATIMVMVMMNNDRLTMSFRNCAYAFCSRLINIFMNSIRWSSIVFMMMIMPMMMVMTVMVMAMVVMIMVVSDGGDRVNEALRLQC